MLVATSLQSCHGMASLGAPCDKVAPISFAAQYSNEHTEHQINRQGLARARQRGGTSSVLTTPNPTRLRFTQMQTFSHPDRLRQIDTDGLQHDLQEIQQ